MNNKLYIIALLASGLFIHFIFFGQPNEVVFDEVHYGKHVNDYLKGTFHFDGHPPLARMTIAGFSKLSGYEPEFKFSQIGEKYPNNQYLILRFLPTLAGAILPLIVFLVMIELGISPLASFAGGLLVALDNGLLTQSRLLLMDAFLLLYGFTSLLFYLRYRNHKKIRMLLLAGIFAGCAFSVKWVGLSFVGIPIILEGLGIISEMKKKGLGLLKTSRVWSTFTALVVAPFIIYFSAITAYSSILHKSGTGDAFMGPGYQKTLQENRYESDPNIKAPNLFNKFLELNKEMYKVNQGLTAGHPYSSKWYAWPFMARPIYYWHEGPQGVPVKESRIYFLGNPVIWWVSTAAIIYLLISLARSVFGLVISKIRTYDIARHKIGFLPALLGGAYLLNLLPFIGITRAMFLYHYMIGLVFTIIALVYLIDRVKRKKIVFSVLLILSLAAFIFFAPLSYGLPLTDAAYNLRVWLPTWQ